MVDIPRANEATRLERVTRCLCLELRLPFTVSHCDRQPRTVHSAEQNRRALAYIHQADASFELCRAVPHETRPQLSTRDQLAQIRQHLTAVAHAERKCI